MSFAVRLDTAPPALQRRLWLALGAFALAASTFALVFADASQRGWIAFAVAACFAVAFARAGRPGFARRPAQGSLSIDEAGRAVWRDTGERHGDMRGDTHERRGGVRERDGGTRPRGDCAPRPVRIERWHVLGALAWLRLRFEDDGQAFDVLLARLDAGRKTPCRDGENDWRRLHAWLLWYGRGATAPDALSGGTAARR